MYKKRKNRTLQEKIFNVVEVIFIVKEVQVIEIVLIVVDENFVSKVFAAVCRAEVNMVLFHQILVFVVLVSN